MVKSIVEQDCRGAIFRDRDKHGRMTFVASGDEETSTYREFAFAPSDLATDDRSAFARENDALKLEIYEDFCRGVGVKDLARKFDRAVASIYRILGPRRAAKVFELPLDYISSPEFERVEGTAAEKQILVFQESENGGGNDDEKTKVSEQKRKKVEADDASIYFFRLDDEPLLTPDEEMFLFRKYNYLKYKAAKTREKLNPKKPKLYLTEAVERLWDEAVATKKRLVSANLRLVVSIVKKFSGGASTSFAELVSDGNLSLMRAVEKFDYTTGNRFSTYATWAIYRNFARSIPDEQKQMERFRASDGALLELKVDNRPTLRQAERLFTEQTERVGRLIRRLETREREIIEMRFGFQSWGKSLTLRQIGNAMGVTKERVRQIELRALAKMRKFAQEEKIELPETIYTTYR